MDPFALIDGISLDQYAELCALLAPYEGNTEPLRELLHEKGVSLESWTAARSGWTNRLEDPSIAPTLATRFVPAYHAALDRVYGPSPTLPFDAYIALTAGVHHLGLLATISRLGLSRHRFAQIAFSWNVAFSRDPQQFVSYVCLLDIEIARLARGEAPRPIPALSDASPANTDLPNAYAPIEYADATPAPIPEPMPITNPTAMGTQAQIQPQKSLEQEASEAAHAVGGALKSGFDKIGGALDAFGKSLSKPNVGSHVLVTWSDGNKYPGTVAEVGQGQYYVTMTDGRQIWVPDAYISSNG